jgi:hypothetical protein
VLDDANDLRVDLPIAYHWTKEARFNILAHMEGG